MIDKKTIIIIEEKEHSKRTKSYCVSVLGDKISKEGKELLHSHFFE